VALFLVVLIGAGSITQGIIEIVGAIALPKQIENECFLIAGPAHCRSCSGPPFFCDQPWERWRLIRLIAGYALLVGVLVITLALRLRSYDAS
jgi:uncharacterized membrane protein HdeD (DUF308 family)